MGGLLGCRHCARNDLDRRARRTESPAVIGSSPARGRMRGCHIVVGLAFTVLAFDSIGHLLVLLCDARNGIQGHTGESLGQAIHNLRVGQQASWSSDLELESLALFRVAWLTGSRPRDRKQQTSLLSRYLQHPLQPIQ